MTKVDQLTAGTLLLSGGDEKRKLRKLETVVIDSLPAVLSSCRSESSYLGQLNNKNG
jgi:hypothetical protein